MKAALKNVMKDELQGDKISFTSTWTCDGIKDERVIDEVRKRRARYMVYRLVREPLIRCSDPFPRAQPSNKCDL